ncbi:PREDICTED: basic blue protein-like [Fragaria vesca subsp. vesca]|uniref:basic blue protein-like n=1 Tax=Fragaria vesca subsp. vesca TaxID=101020 RepID=UPI0002C306B0|nr:PREDICTED: basic blue protein-like [Fragaria vesca subsp. vesca]
MQMAQCSTALVVIAFLLVSLSMVLADQYIVGDIGWGEQGVDYNAWAASNTFYTGDVLIFHYDPTSHNVVVATGSDTFDNCVTHPNLGIYTTANDELHLNDPGTYYFICEFQCGVDDMKMMVTVNN